MLKIALPNKGRLVDDVYRLFDDAGLSMAKNERALTARLGSEFEAIFVRAQDIPEFVADGAADVGVTGLDLVQESQRDVVSLLDLGLGKCRLVVAVRDESSVRQVQDIAAGARIATVFPKVTEAYFREAAKAVTIVPVSGAAEIAPHLGIADIVVDLTSTGSTLKVNGLREVTTVLHSSAHLVTRPSNRELPQLQELTVALSSVLRARGQRYLMANVPKDRVREVRACLPGLNGPTLSEVLDGNGFMAMHAVVPADSIYRTIAQLRGLGCQGILVTRIERLMP